MLIITLISKTSTTIFKTSKLFLVIAVRDFNARTGKESVFEPINVQFAR